MPILQALGPSAGRASPPPQTSRATTARRDVAVPMPTLEWNEEVAHDTAHLYERVRAVIPAVEWPFFAPYVKAINALKRVRNAVILAHNYQTPEIYNCVADFVGDSLQLAREAMKVDADIIVQCGVHFMAETSKILNPDKTVLIPDLKAGCSLASSISGADVRLLRAKFPGVPVVAYVNTSAEVKAEVDICCTSSNALEVVESLGADTVIFLPDQYLAKYVAAHTKVKIISCARRARRGGLYRLNRRHDRVGAQQAAAPRRHGHGVLDGGQRAGRITRGRIRASVQSLPAYEADYAAEDSRKSRIPQGGGRDRSRNRRAGAPIGRADGKLETLTGWTLSSPRGAPRDARVAGTPLRGTHIPETGGYGFPLSRERQL